MTIRVRLVLWALLERPVAETVTVKVPAGVPFGLRWELEPLLQLSAKPHAASRRAKAAIILQEFQLQEFHDLRRLGTAMSASKPNAPQANQPAEKNRGELASGRFAARVREVVLMVSVLEALENPGVTDEEPKLQDAPVGKPVQVKPAIGAVYGNSFGTMLSV